MFWEIALLARKRRIDINVPITAWVDLVIEIPRIRVIDISPVIAIRSDELDMHPDPADRFIVASTLHCNGKLVSKDRLLRMLTFVETVW